MFVDIGSEDFALGTRSAYPSEYDLCFSSVLKIRFSSEITFELCLQSVYIHCPSLVVNRIDTIYYELMNFKLRFIRLILEFTDI